VPVHVVVATPRSAAAEASLAATMDPVLWASTDASPSNADTGHVVFHLGAALYAVAVTEVREVIRGVDLGLVPDSAHHVVGRPVALVDARGRTVPVVDLRTDPTVPGDVLLPVWRRHLGIAVDRVESVLRSGELVAEPDDVAGSLPSYARGVMRPVDGGSVVILIALPDAAPTGITAERRVPFVGGPGQT
jgi:chemotaxis signal transduction protein